MTQSFEERLMLILEGIDKDQCEDKKGWWETSTGSDFGKRKLQKIKAFIRTEISRAKKEEWKRCVDLLNRDHSNCPIKESCVGYMNAQSDLMNNPPEQSKK